ncbi:hypothetical protein [Helicobacter suis]|uniref:hypothetical protein n=1 Tax=Helicobacter suis TaxID=104628 RepID=UPI0013D72153|nr:hypothetical protein [Helicobacter suis]
MDFTTALKKLEDRISGLNTMRGRLLKFVNPQTAPATQTNTQPPAQNSAPEVESTSTPTQAPTQTQIAPAPEVELSKQERQERLNLINQLIRTRNITNNDLAPLGLHFENYEVFKGVVWRNNELTQDFKDYMRGLDSISVFAVVYEAMGNAEFRKLDFTLITGDSGVASFYYRYVLGLVELYTKQINATQAIHDVLFALVASATQYLLMAANAPTDNTEAQDQAKARVTQLQEAFSEFYRDFGEDRYNLVYSFIFACRPLEAQLQESLTLEYAITLRRNMRPDYYQVIPQIIGGFSPRV